MGLMTDLFGGLFSSPSEPTFYHPEHDMHFKGTLEQAAAIDAQAARQHQPTADEMQQRYERERQRTQNPAEYAAMRMRMQNYSQLASHTHSVTVSGLARNDLVDMRPGGVIRVRPEQGIIENLRRTFPDVPRETSCAGCGANSWTNNICNHCGSDQ